MATDYRTKGGLFILMIVLAVAGIAPGQSKHKTNRAMPVMWEPVNIKQRNLYYGPGGTEMRPNLRRIKFIKKETGGNNLKYRIQDASGRVWVAKIADESQPEVVAVRLLWGIGYKTEINYLVPRLTIPGKGTFRNVSLEARPDHVDRDGRWKWKDNPFEGTSELQGLKIMMALVNNWDLKDGNNAVLVTGNQRQYVISDLGSSFGKLPFSSFFILNRFGRSVNNPPHYARSSFIKGIDEEDQEVDMAYKGKAVRLMKNITREDAWWTARLLSQLSDRQISDAFRAANYTRPQVAMLTREVRSRIRELQLVNAQYGMQP